LAAQTVASCAAKLGLTAAVRTAASEAEAMTRQTERPADVELADTALTRPDSAGFTRRVLARAPGAVIVLFGAEEPRKAAAAVAAGARGLIRGTDHDPVGTVAKALLLLGVPARTDANGRPDASPTAGEQAASASAGDAVAARPAAGARAADSGGAAGNWPDTANPGGRTAAGEPAAATPAGAVASQSGGPAVVPAQRGDLADPTVTAQAGDPANGDPAGPGRPQIADPPARRLVLTERELQVLHGMADGKSNAEIGRELFVSEDTVKTHARRLFRKLGARDRAHAVAAGFRAGLVA
jgi:DNA-binding NarL/FixJ family response regulator